MDTHDIDKTHSYEPANELKTDTDSSTNPVIKDHRKHEGDLYGEAANRFAVSRDTAKMIALYFGYQPGENRNPYTHICTECKLPRTFSDPDDTVCVECLVANKRKQADTCMMDECCGRLFRAGFCRPHYLEARLNESKLSLEDFLPNEGNTLRGKILKQARALTEGDRNKAYGDPKPNLECYTRLVHAFNDAMAGSTHAMPDGTYGAVLMVLAKVSRIAANPYHADNYVDGAAYVAIAGECAERFNDLSTETDD